MPSTSTLHLNGVMGPRRTIAAKSAAVIAITGTLRFKLPPNKNVFTLPAQMQKYPLPPADEFILKEGGEQ